MYSSIFHPHEIDYRCNFVSHLFHFQTSKCDVHIVIYACFFFQIHSQVKGLAGSVIDEHENLR